MSQRLVSIMSTLLVSDIEYLETFNDFYVVVLVLCLIVKLRFPSNFSISFVMNGAVNLLAARTFLAIYYNHPSLEYLF